VGPFEVIASRSCVYSWCEQSRWTLRTSNQQLSGHAAMAGTPPDTRSVRCEHQFEIHPLGPGRVRFVQQERFTGVLVPLFARNMDDHTLRGFNAMNAALKARAEAAVGNQAVVTA
jgi:hypothetical protein